MIKKADLTTQILKDIEFVTIKINTIRERYQSETYLDVKVQSDLERYSKTRLHLMQTLKELGQVG